jgi:hypothetical protein
LLSQVAREVVELCLTVCEGADPLGFGQHAQLPRELPHRPRIDPVGGAMLSAKAEDLVERDGSEIDRDGLQIECDDAASGRRFWKLKQLGERTDYAKLIGSWGEIKAHPGATRSKDLSEKNQDQMTHRRVQRDGHPIL